MQLSDASRLIFQAVSLISILLIYFSIMWKKPEKASTSNEDNFIVYAPRQSLFAMVFLVFLFGSIAALVLRFIYSIGILSLLLVMLWILFSALILFTLYIIYGIIYYASFKTVVEGDTIIHKELFYPEFTFTFRDISSARFGKRVGNPMLIISDATEVLLEAEDHFIGYDLFIASIERKATVKIEEEL